jgi:hypothetical protein
LRRAGAAIRSPATGRIAAVLRWENCTWRHPDFADWLAICNTKADYCRLLDTKQWEAWSQVFTEDVVVDVPESGRTSNHEPR